MGGPELATDPYLRWIEDSLTTSAPPDLRDTADIKAIQKLVAETRHAIETGSSKPAEGAAGRHREETMDPEWVARWLSFDVDHLVDVEEPSGRQNRKNSVLIDASTIGLAEEYVDRRYPPSPLGLLDLANLVNNRVLRENLVGLGHRLRTRTRFRTMQDGIAALSGRDSVITAAALLSIRRLNGIDPVAAWERKETARTWSAILGAEAPPAEDMFDVPIEDALYYLNAKEAQSPDGADNSTAYIINELFATEPASDPEVRLRAIQAANCRAVLNLEAARHFDLPYAGGLTRLPMKRILWLRGRRSDAVLSAVEPSDLRTVPLLDAAYRRKVDESLATRQSAVVLPVFLAAVLTRIKHLSEFHERTDDLRNEATPLRRRLAEIEAALAGGPDEETRETQRLLTAFRDDSRLLRKTVWETLPAVSAIAGVVLAAGTANPAWLTATVALLHGGDKLSSRTWNRLANRVWRRHLWFVTELGQRSNSLVDMTSRMERLWAVPFGEGFRKRLDSLSGLGTY